MAAMNLRDMLPIFIFFVCVGLLPPSLFAEINEDAWRRLREQRQTEENERLQLAAAIGISKGIENTKTKRREAEEFQMQREAFALEKKRKELELLRIQEEIDLMREMRRESDSPARAPGTVGIDPQTGKRMVKKNGDWIPEDDA